MPKKVLRESEKLKTGSLFLYLVEVVVFALTEKVINFAEFGLHQQYFES